MGSWSCRGWYGQSSRAGLRYPLWWYYRKMTPPTCTIKRRANSLDEHSLERAQRMAGKRNLDTMEIFPFSVYLKIAFQPIHPT